MKNSRPQLFLLENVQNHLCTDFSRCKHFFSLARMTHFRQPSSCPLILTRNPVIVSLMETSYSVFEREIYRQHNYSEQHIKAQKPHRKHWSTRHCDGCLKIADRG